MKDILTKNDFTDKSNEELSLTKKLFEQTLKTVKKLRLKFLCLLFINTVLIIFMTVQCTNLFKKHSYILMIVSVVVLIYDVFLFNRNAVNLTEINADMGETKTYIEFINQIIKDRGETNVID